MQNKLSITTKALLVFLVCVYLVRWSLDLVAGDWLTPLQKVSTLATGWWLITSFGKWFNEKAGT